MLLRVSSMEGESGSLRGQRSGRGGCQPENMRVKCGANSNSRALSQVWALLSPRALWIHTDGGPVKPAQQKGGTQGQGGCRNLSFKKKG